MPSILQTANLVYHRSAWNSLFYYPVELDRIPFQVTRAGAVVRGQLIGPDHPLRKDRGPLTVPFTVTVQGPDRAVLRIGGQRYQLEKGRYTEWVPVCFRTFPLIKSKAVSVASS